MLQEHNDIQTRWAQVLKWALLHLLVYFPFYQDLSPRGSEQRTESSFLCFSLTTTLQGGFNREKELLALGHLASVLCQNGGI